MMLTYSVCLTPSQVFLHLDHNICLQVASFHSNNNISIRSSQLCEFHKKSSLFDLVILKPRITSTLSRSFLSLLIDKQ